MECPKCNTSNEPDAYYCDFCGYQLKKKFNILAILFAVLFVVAGIVAGYFYNKFESRGDRINNLTRRIEAQKTEIENIKTRLPQTYKTRSSREQLYNKCLGEYKKIDCYITTGSTLIYRQEGDYGLTNYGGWVPMNRLEK